MPSQMELLISCFSSVFPALTREQILEASVDATKEWDSLASATLIAVLEQEFSIEVDLLDAPLLSSFASIEKYLSTRRRLLSSLQT